MTNTCEDGKNPVLIKYKSRLIIEEFIDQINEHVERQNITASELSDATGIKVKTIKRILTYQTTPSIKSVAKMLLSLHLDIEVKATDRRDKLNNLEPNEPVIYKSVNF